jgi:hypothetical protein
MFLKSNKYALKIKRKYPLLREPGSSVSIVSGYGLGDRAIEVRSPAEAKGFFLCPDRLWGPPSLLYNGYWGSFPVAKARPGLEADYSPPM